MGGVDSFSILNQYFPMVSTHSIGILIPLSRMCFNLDLGHSLGLKRYNYIVLQMIITNMYLKDLTIIGLPLIIVIGHYVYEIMQKLH